MKKIVLLLGLNSIFLFGQQKCEVLKEDISGVYKGDCKKGMAHGKGIAQGLNVYEGEFKKGLPNGEGMITYADGGIYYGKWKNGLKEGEGKYTKTINGKDSVVDGVWKNDKFVGKKKTKQYEVFKKTSVSRYTIRKVGDISNKVSIKASNKGKDVKVNITNTSSGNVVSRYGYTFIENINFYPFTCEMRYIIPSEFGAVAVQVEFSFRIFEPGEWLVELKH